MSPEADRENKLRVVVVGGGVAALETVLALRDLARELVTITLLAPNDEFVYRPMTIREPFAYARAARYPLVSVLGDTGAEHVLDKLGWVDREKQLVHTEGGAELAYDALVLGLGAKSYPRYKHAITIDDQRMDETLHGLIQDIEQGYLRSVAFVAPGRMAWPLPLYELALMTAGRAYDMNVRLEATIVTPEDAPLAVFGKEVSNGVGELLAAKGIRTITSGYAEIPTASEVVINPGDRRLRASRVIALPELYGPSVAGLPVGEHGFLAFDRFCRVPHVGPVFAAGDAADFAVKQGGLGAQQADAVAESVALLAGAEIEPRGFDPVIHGVLLTDERPRYITAKITGGHGFASHFSESPIEGLTDKIAAKHLGPRLAELDPSGVAA